MWNRNFIMVVIGQIISLFGNAILRFALPLYLLNETESAALFGVVTACAFIPMIVLAPIGGILADRVNKRNIMVVLDFSTAILVLAIILLLGKINLVALLLCALFILYGINGAYQPAVQASIPILLSGENIMQGNSVINLVSSFAGLIGPVIGGALFGFYGIMPILYVSIFCFLISAIMEIFIQMEVFLEKDNMTGFRLIVTDSAAGAKYYELEKTMDGGKNWTLANADPFDGKLGLAEGIEFFTKDNGYIGITDALGTYSQIYVTHDGGCKFRLI